VREIQVRGGEKVGGGEIVAMAGLKHGMNLWKIEPGAIEKKIAKHPWVRRVLVRRNFPAASLSKWKSASQGHCRSGAALLRRCRRRDF